MEVGKFDLDRERNRSIEIERSLAATLEARDEQGFMELLGKTDRESLEFTGRCFSLALEQGLRLASRACALAGFHLDVTDEPAVQAALERSEDRVRGLREFLQGYRYCKAQRTYYLPVVQSELSVCAVQAALETGRGFSKADLTEMLSLAVRLDKTELARVLRAHGADLPREADRSIPLELRKNAPEKLEDPWLEAVSPHHDDAMLAFLLEQIQPGAACVRSVWFKLYFRDPQFAKRLAAIVCACDNGAQCEDIPSTLLVLAQSGQVKAVKHALQWPQVSNVDLQPPLDAARKAGHVETVALLLEAGQAVDDELEELAW